MHFTAIFILATVAATTQAAQRANPSFAAANPSLARNGDVNPSLALGARVIIDDLEREAVLQECGPVAAGAIPDCAQQCFMKAAVALGCESNDFACQCSQQANLMSGAESCVGTGCPTEAHQKAIDGVMSVCDCAVGTATAGLPAMEATDAPTAVRLRDVAPSLGVAAAPSLRGQVAPCLRRRRDGAQPTVAPKLRRD